MDDANKANDTSGQEESEQGQFTPPSYTVPNYAPTGAPLPPPPPSQQAPYPVPGSAQYTAPDAPPQVSTRRYLIIAGAAIVAAVLSSVAFLAGGEPGKFMEIGIQFAPFAILAALAYSGVKNSVAGVFTYIWLGLLGVLVLLNALANVLLPYMGDIYSKDATRLLKPGGVAALLWAMLLLTIISLVSLSMFLRPVRVVMSHIMPIDPDNFVHKIALVILSLILLSSFVPIIVLGGRPPILELVNSDAVKSLGDNSGLNVRPIDLIYQFVWMIPATIVAAGWPIARKFPAALERLGMVRPTLVQVGTAIGLGLGLAAFSTFVLDPGITSLWHALGWTTTDLGAFNNLMSKVVTPVGAALVGVTAGIGEEMAVRGLLQPRIGLLASNLVFTSLHAFQYGFDGLLSVFVIGLILGIIRSRSNTSTSAIVHGLYDFTLVLASALTGQ